MGSIDTLARNAMVVNMVSCAPFVGSVEVVTLAYMGGLVTDARNVEGKLSASMECCAIIVWSAEGTVSASMGRDAIFARNVVVQFSVYMESSSVHVRIAVGKLAACMEDYASPAASVLAMLLSAPLKAAPSLGMRFPASQDFGIICRECIQETRRP